jgi:hypothetical protein
MGNSIDFVKGHCGWDILTLLVGEHVPDGKEIETALKIFNPPVSGGIEVGFMYPRKGEEDIRLRIIDSTHKTWIPMCGGMSQVIGKAVVETFVRERFGIKISSPGTTINLLTDSGMVPLEIEIKDNKAVKVTTVMSDYCSYLYGEGVQPVEVMGINAMRVGYFLVINIEALEWKYPGVEFAQRSPGPHQDIIRQILINYMKQEKITDGVFSMLYDLRPEGKGHARLFPRFYDKTESTASIPWEFQCGTGTIAAGLAMAELGELPFKGNEGTIVYEWGSQRLTPDPYGMRTSELKLGLQNNRAVIAGFSHSVIEILCEGKLNLPNY